MPLFGSEAHRAFLRGDFLRAGDLYKAEGNLEKALHSYLKGGDPLAAARLQEEMGHIPAAVELYLRAGDRDAAIRLLVDRNSFARAAQLCAEGGDYPRAAAFAEKGGDPAAASLYFEQAGRFWDASEQAKKGGQAARGVLLLERALSQFPSEEGLNQRELESWRDKRRLAARFFEEGGAPEKAAQLYEGLSEHPDAARCYEAAGLLGKAAELYERLGRREKAAALSGRLSETPSRPLVVTEEESPSQMPTSTVSVHEEIAQEKAPTEQEAQACELAGNLAGAAAIWQALGEMERAGNLYFKAGDFQNAGDCFRGAFLYALAGQCYGRTGDRPLAVQMALEGGQWEDAFTLARGDDALLQEFIHRAQNSGAGRSAGHSATLLVVRAFLELCQPAMALHLLDARNELFHESPTWAHYLSGRASEALGNPNEAATAYRKVLSLEIAFQDAALRLQALGAPSGELVAGRYEILEELGRGGMGEVFRVRDRELDEIVALKTLRPRTPLSEVDRLRFLNEIKLSRKITHPNVVRVFDLGSWGELTFLTMEFVAGPTLSYWMREGEGANSSLGERVEILKGVARGLAEAHRLGIIHRDLKPQNVMLGPSAVPKVLDFGIAMARGGSDPSTDDHFVGSPKYVSPEQVQGKPADARSDIYSFGLLAFFLLTGEDAFSGDQPELLLLSQLREMPPPVSTKIRVPRSLDRLVTWCLAKKPAERPPSLREVLKALEEIA